ncbi:uncharacterized protein LOC123920485 [Trifolium pratense]|uniref:uncharacterized protein LOC123920485 n=1 Tax=Trifolium pratense TaxID=57577 RepID=UPI001E6930E6|nr:uncharacterized protein LOC123920485 [Trifolium pratense]
MAYMKRLVIELSKPDLRENAIRVLSKLFHELAPLLWNSVGTIEVLLQEITSIYPNLSPPTLSHAQSTRVCNVIALLRCLASHPDTMSLIMAMIPMYLYPFLQTTNTLPQFDWLRLASLGVIGVLVKARSKEVIPFLLSNEIIPLCLHSMEIGNELSKSAATFILQKILMDEDGLAYVCATAHRFFAVSRILDMVMEYVQRQPSSRLLKLIIPCYSRLSENRGRAGIALTSSLPGVFANPAFINSLREDPTTWRWAEQLYENIRKNRFQSDRMYDIVWSTSSSGYVSFVAPLHVSSQSSSAIDWTAYMERLVIELSKPDLRENAIRVLSKLFHELAPLLWNSVGTIAVLLQEIISIYPNLSPPTLSPTQSTRVCNVLCVASHPNTRMSLIIACIPQYVYPFLETTNILPQFDYLRVASLGVIGALVKANSKEVILFLLSTEIIPLCLRSMEIGKELSKNVATFILQKILLDDDGLAYVCATTDRFFAVRRILDMVLESHERQPSTQLLKLIIPCYSRLSQNRRAGIALTSSLPVVFANPAFINSLREDPTTWRWMEQLYENIRKNHVQSARTEVQMDDIVDKLCV